MYWNLNPYWNLNLTDVSNFPVVSLHKCFVSSRVVTQPFFQPKHKYQEKMSSAVFELLSRDNVVFRAYAFWASVLLLKTLAMSMLTAMQRFRTKVSWRRMWICGRSRMCIRIATTLDIDFGLALCQVLPHTLSQTSRSVTRRNYNYAKMLYYWIS